MNATDPLLAALAAYNGGDWVQARGLCEAALTTMPGRADGWTLLGMIRRKTDDLEGAAEAYRRSVALMPDYADAWHNLGNLEQERGRLPEALEDYRRAVALRPGWAEGHNRLGTVLHALGRLPEALASFQAALALAPDNADIHWDYALALLAAGRYDEGWREYEWRWARRQPEPRHFAQPAWQGESLAGRRLLVYMEQGFGDALQFLRFLPLVRALGPAQIILEVQPALLPLLDGELGVDQAVAAGEPLPEFDCHVALLTLALRLGIDLAKLPSQPYLRAPAAAQARWQALVANAAAEPAPKVGLVWAGNPNVKNDHWRSPRLAPLAPLLAVEGVRFYALQKGDGRKDLAAVPAASRIVDLGEELADFGDTAAALMQMDLVITTDTSVAHLAGALGRPVWLMLHACPDWRWGCAGRDNAWYPSARLYRQERLGDWSGVARALADDLQEWVLPSALLKTAYSACPLCASHDFHPLRRFDCRGHGLWHRPLPTTLAWCQCQACGHVFTDGYFTETGLSHLFARAHASQLAGGDFDQQRFVWSRVVESVVACLPPGGENARRWLDVGCGNGALVFTAAEYGFAAVGLDARAEAVDALAGLGYRAVQGDLMTVELDPPYDVISLADVVEHIPYPPQALARVRQLLGEGGLVFLSCPNSECASWRALDRAGSNPYWIELEHLHNFSRSRLVALLRQCGFEPLRYGVSQRYKACMELVARKSAP